MLKTLQPHIIRIHNQQNTNACASCATILSYEIMNSIKNKKETFSSMFLYYYTRKNQNLIVDNGSSIIDNLEILKNVGVCREYYWNFSLPRINIEPTIDALNDANNYKIKSYKQISLNEYKLYLDNNIPIICAIKTGRLFWKLTGNINNHNYNPINDFDNRESFNHAVTIIGYDDNLNNGSWIIANSVGNKWGDNGIAAISYSCNENIYESFVIEM